MCGEFMGYKFEKYEYCFNNNCSNESVYFVKIDSNKHYEKFLVRGNNNTFTSKIDFTVYKRYPCECGIIYIKDYCREARELTEKQIFDSLISHELFFTFLNAEDVEDAESIYDEIKDIVNRDNLVDVKIHKIQNHGNGSVKIGMLSTRRDLQNLLHIIYCLDKVNLPD